MTPPTKQKLKMPPSKCHFDIGDDWWEIQCGQTPTVGNTGLCQEHLVISYKQLENDIKRQQRKLEILEGDLEFLKKLEQREIEI